MKKYKWFLAALILIPKVAEARTFQCSLLEGEIVIRADYGSKVNFLELYKFDNYHHSYAKFAKLVEKPQFGPHLPFIEMTAKVCPILFESEQDIIIFDGTKLAEIEEIRLTVNYNPDSDNAIKNLGSRNYDGYLELLRWDNKIKTSEVDCHIDRESSSVAMP